MFITARQILVTLAEPQYQIVFLVTKMEPISVINVKQDIPYRTTNAHQFV